MMINLWEAEWFFTGKDGVKKPPFLKNGGMGRNEEFSG
jgi:hypothetical protein